MPSAVTSVLLEDGDVRIVRLVTSSGERFFLEFRDLKGRWMRPKTQGEIGWYLAWLSRCISDRLLWASEKTETEKKE